VAPRMATEMWQTSRFTRVFRLVGSRENQSVEISFHKGGCYVLKKKWQSAYSILEYAESTLKPNVNVLLQKGKYHLMAQQIELSKTYYEKALKWNPRLDVQKELGIDKILAKKEENKETSCSRKLKMADDKKAEKKGLLKLHYANTISIYN
jgi:tetratricopeptide (TPR) repeat protein